MQRLRADHCDRSACRYRAELALWRVRRDAALAATRAAAGRRDPHALATQAPLVWLAAHPGHSPGEAAAEYLALLPKQHVEASCLHHGRSGCTLPKAMRSDICNHCACEALHAGEVEASRLPLRRQRRKPPRPA